MDQESPTSLPELYFMRDRLIKNRSVLPHMYTQSRRKAGWLLFGAAGFLPGLILWPQGIESGKAFLWGVAWAIWVVGFLWYLRKIWAALHEVAKLDKENQRVLADINEEIKKRVA